MIFKILEDCSPYYIRMTHPGLSDIVELGKKILNDQLFSESKGSDALKYQILKTSDAKTIYDLSPFAVIDAPTSYMGILTAGPKSYYTAHKDGLSNRFGINYYIDVKDNSCNTNWYSDDVAQSYQLTSQGPYTRELKDFNPDAHIPVASTVFSQGECVLFNVDIFHDFDNRQGVHSRSLLSLRCRNEGSIYFDDVKSILFNSK